MILLIMCLFYLKEKLIRFILATQDDETGGFADRPGDMVSWSFIHYQNLLYRKQCWVVLCVKRRKNSFPKPVLHFEYRSGTVNSKSFVGKVLLRIKWKFELTNAL